MECKVKNAPQEKDLLVLGGLLQGSVEILLGILEHLNLGLWFDGLVNRVLHDAHGSQQERVSLLALLLGSLREECY